MTKEIWITVIATIIQVVTMFIIGYWQVATAKKIVAIGNKVEIKNNGFFLNLFSKYFNSIINCTIIFSVLVVFVFLFSDIKMNNFLIVYLVFVTSTIFYLLISKMLFRFVEIGKDGFELLYCMVCRSREENKPICLEKVKEMAKITKNIE